MHFSELYGMLKLFKALLTRVGLVPIAVVKGLVEPDIRVGIHSLGLASGDNTKK